MKADYMYLDGRLYRIKKVPFSKQDKKDFAWSEMNAATLAMMPNYYHTILVETLDSKIRFSVWHRITYAWQGLFRMLYRLYVKWQTAGIQYGWRAPGTEIDRELAEMFTRPLPPAELDVKVEKALAADDTMLDPKEVEDILAGMTQMRESTLAEYNPTRNGI